MDGDGRGGDAEICRVLQGTAGLKGAPVALAN
jgi:hypothetical protein